MYNGQVADELNFLPVPEDSAPCSEILARVNQVLAPFLEDLCPSLFPFLYSKRLHTLNL